MSIRRSAVCAASALLLLHGSVAAASAVAGGWISGDTAWGPDTVLVTDTVWIDTGATLTILPGTVVQFMGTYRISVMGRLLAAGTVDDSIVFTAADTTANYLGGWTGIRFQNVAALTDSSRLEYCRLEYARSLGSGLDGYGGAVFVHSFSKVVVSRCMFRSNLSAGGGAAICCWLASPVIRENTMRGNAGTGSTFAFGGAIFCQSGSPLIEGNVLTNNSCREGGAIACQGGSPRIAGNIIMNNVASNEGGGIRCIESSRPSIVGNLICGNQANDGGAVFCNMSTARIANCTVAANRASNGNLRSEMSSITVTGSVLWGNTGALVSLFNNGSVLFQYSDAQGVSSGTGNLDADPLFVNAAANDYRLADGSPCINGGMADTSGLGLPSLDMAGDPRIHGGRVDMGAYESRWSSGPDFAQFKASPVAIVTRSAQEGAHCTLVVAASGWPAPVHRVISAAPPGLAIDSLTGAIDWTPGYTQAGQYDLRILAENALGTDTGAVRIDVANVKIPCTMIRPANGDSATADSLLVWSASPDPDVDTGLFYRLRFYRDTIYTDANLLAVQDSLTDTAIGIGGLAGFGDLPVYEPIYWYAEALDTHGHTTGYSAARAWFLLSQPITGMHRNAQRAERGPSLSVDGSLDGRHAVVRFTSGPAGRGVLSIVNTAGRVLSEAEVGEEGTLALRLADGIPVGRFVCRLETDGRSICRVFVLFR